MSAYTAYGELITALVTPFTHDLSLDVTCAEKLMYRQFEAGVDSLLLCGTTGESPTLSTQEKLEICAAAVKLACDVRQHSVKTASIIANIGSYNTRASIELALMMKDLGVDALMAVVPYYNKPPQEGLYQHFMTIAQAAQLPLILYNIPGRCSCALETDTILRLFEDSPYIVGLKQAVEGLEQSKELLARTGADFLLYAGNDEQCLDLMELGARGVISTTSNLLPQFMADMCHAWSAGKREEARALEQRLMPLMRGLFETSNPILVKKGLELLGLCSSQLRLPLVSANELQGRKLADILYKVLDE